MECKIFNSMAARVPTHVPTLRGHLFYGCPKYSRVMHAVYPWETLTLTGLSASKGYLLVLDLYVLYTPHAWILSWLRSLSRMDNKSIISRPHLRGPLIWLDRRGPRSRLMPISSVDVRGLASTVMMMIWIWICNKQQCWWSGVATRDGCDKGSGSVVIVVVMVLGGGKGWLWQK